MTIAKKIHNKIIAEEIEKLNKKIVQYNIQPVGNMAIDKKDGRVQIFFGQPNNMSTETVRKIKIKSINYIKKM